MTSPSLADQLRRFATRLPELVRDHEVLHVVGRMEPSAPTDTTKNARHEVLKWAQNQIGGHLPKEAWTYGPFEHVSGGRNCQGVRIDGGEAELWAVRTERPDKDIPGRVWTTEIVVGHQTNESPRVSIRLLASSSESRLSIDPHVPGVTRQLTDKVGLVIDGRKASPNPWLISDQSQLDELVDFICDPGRRLPIYALSVPEGSSDPSATTIDVRVLTQATLGLSHVAIVPADQCWMLTRIFGKRLSVYGGAARIYCPGFDEDADPYSHRLFLAERIEAQEGAADCLRFLRNFAATESLRRTRLGKEVVEFAAVRSASLQLRQEALQRQGAGNDELLDIANQRLRALEGDLQAGEHLLGEASARYNAEHERANHAESQLRTAHYRIQQLLQQLKERGVRPDTNVPMPQSWDEFSTWCETHLAGRVALTARARREVAKAEFEGLEQAARCLLWLANECRDGRLKGGIDLRDFPVEAGIRNSLSGGDEFSFVWQSRPLRAQWHMKNGGNTRDPKRCLRIYYDWDDESEQIVVASMPAHVHTDAT